MPAELDITKHIKKVLQGRTNPTVEAGQQEAAGSCILHTIRSEQLVTVHLVPSDWFYHLSLHDLTAGILSALREIHPFKACIYLN